MTKRIAVAVGHHGPRTGTWWQDPEGSLDEYAIAARFAVAAMGRLLELGWEVYPITGTYKYPNYLYEKAQLVEKIQPTLVIEFHADSRCKDGTRGTRWRGCFGAVFDEGKIPDESDFAAGINVVYYEANQQARSLALKLVHWTTEHSRFSRANDDGLDPRPLVSTKHRKRVYLPLACDPSYRRSQHDKRSRRWHGCPCVLLECGAVTSPQDRAVLRDQPRAAVQVAFGVGSACEEWYMTHCAGGQADAGST